MSIDKFGSHIFGKDSKFSLSTDTTKDNLLKIVDLSNVKLYYNLVLPFVGIYNPNATAFELLQDKRLKYDFPMETSLIIKGDYPKKDVVLKINGKIITEPEGLQLKKGDAISFHRTKVSKIPEFYGELLIKCAVEIEK